MLALLQTHPLYRIVLLVHLLAVVVGFGSTFVYVYAARRARSLSPEASYAVNDISLKASKALSTPCIYAAGAAGLLLVVISQVGSSKGGASFDQVWISAAFVLFIAAALVAGLLHAPNLRAMNELQAKLVSGGASPAPAGEVPPEVSELQERGQRAGMYGGILHLFFLLLMIDMVWKPGYGS